MILRSMTMTRTKNPDPLPDHNCKDTVVVVRPGRAFPDGACPIRPRTSESIDLERSRNGQVADSLSARRQSRRQNRRLSRESLSALSAMA